MRGDHDGHTLFERTSWNTNGTSTLIQRRGIRCSSQKEHQLDLVCNPRHKTWDEKSQSGSILTLRRAKEFASRVGIGKIRHLDTVHNVAGSRTKQTLERKTLTLRL